MPCEQARKTITEIYNLGEIDDCIAKLVSEEFRQDFKQELFLILLDIPCEKVNQMTDYFKLFVIRIILNLVRQKRNIFHKKYLDRTVEYNTDKLSHFLQDSDNTEEMAERREIEEFLVSGVDGIDIELGNKRWPYHAAMIKLLVKFGSRVEVAKQTGISTVQIHRTLKRIREHLKK